MTDHATEKVGQGGKSFSEQRENNREETARRDSMSPAERAESAAARDIPDPEAVAEPASDNPIQQEGERVAANPIVPIDAEFVRLTATLAEPVALAVQKLVGALKASRQAVLAPLEIDQYVNQIIQVAERLKMLEKFKG